jgi:hypothetical protein
MTFFCKSGNFFFFKFFFLQQIFSKFKQIFYFYKTVHGSACNQVLGDVLVVFAGRLQHCDIVSVTIQGIKRSHVELKL